MPHCRPTASLLRLPSTVTAVTSGDVCLQCSSEFLAMTQAKGSKLMRQLKHEREQRVRLQETLEQVAQQHLALERQAAMEAKDKGCSAINPGMMSSDEETEFHDALDEMEMDNYFETTGGRRHK